MIRCSGSPGDGWSGRDGHAAWRPPLAVSAERPAALLGIRIRGIEEFCARALRGSGHRGGHARGAVPSRRRGGAVLRLVRALRTEGHSNDWPGESPLLRVLEDCRPGGDDAQGGEPCPLADAVRRRLNGYNNQVGAASALCHVPAPRAPPSGLFASSRLSLSRSRLSLTSPLFPRMPFPSPLLPFPDRDHRRRAPRAFVERGDAAS